MKQQQQTETVKRGKKKKGAVADWLTAYKSDEAELKSEEEKKKREKLRDTRKNKTHDDEEEEEKGEVTISVYEYLRNLFGEKKKMKKKQTNKQTNTSLNRLVVYYQTGIFPSSFFFAIASAPTQQNQRQKMFLIFGICTLYV